MPRAPATKYWWQKEVPQEWEKEAKYWWQKEPELPPEPTPPFEIKPTPKPEEEIETKYQEERKKLEEEWDTFSRSFPKDVETNWLVPSSKRYSYMEGKKVYETESKSLESWKIEALSGLATTRGLYDKPQLLSARLQVLSSGVDVETFQQSATEYRQSLESLRDYLVKQEAPAADIEEATKQLAEAVGMERDPIRYMPEAERQRRARLSLWQRSIEQIGETYHTAIFGKELPFWQRALGFVAAPFAPLERPIERFEEFIGVKPWAARWYGVWTALPGYQRGEEQYRKIYGWWGALRAGAPSVSKREVAVYESLGEPSAWALSWIHPAWVLVMLLPTRVVTTPLKIVSQLPKIIRAVPQSSKIVRLTTAWQASLIKGYKLTPQGFFAMEPTYSALGEMSLKLLQLMKPTAYGAALAMSPIARSAAITLWTGAKVSRAVAGLVALPIKGVGFVARPGITALRRLVTLKTINAAATPQGFQVVRVSKAMVPPEGAPALFAIRNIETGKVEVWARDLSEVQAWLLSPVDNRSLVVASDIGLRELLYIDEFAKIDPLKGAPTRAEFMFSGGVIRETPLGTVFSHSGIELKVITQAQGVKPAWATKEMWQAARKSFTQRGYEDNIQRVTYENPAFPSNEEFLLAFEEKSRWVQLVASKVPGAEKVIKAINRSALAENFAEQAAIVYFRLLDMGKNWTSMALKFVEQYGNMRSLFGAKMEQENLVLLKVRLKPGLAEEKVSRFVYDVLQWIPDASESPFIFTPEQAAWIKEAHKMVDIVHAWAAREGIVIPKVQIGIGPGQHYFPRITEGLVGQPTEEIVFRGTRRIGRRTLHEEPRVYALMADGVAKGVRYGSELPGRIALEHYVQSVIRRIADERLGQMIRPLGETVQQIAERMAPGLRGRWINEKNTVKFLGNGGKVVLVKEGVITIDRVPGLLKEVKEIARGKVLHPATQKKIDKLFPEIGNKLRKLRQLAIPPGQKRLYEIIEQYENLVKTLEKRTEVLARKDVLEKDVKAVEKQLQAIRAQVKELPTDEVMRQAVGLMDDEVRIAFRNALEELSMDLGREAEESAIKAQALREALASDPIYQTTVTYPSAVIKPAIPKKAIPKVEAAAKEPWQMTQREWEAFREPYTGTGAYETIRGVRGKVEATKRLQWTTYGVKKVDPETGRALPIFHRDVIAKALAEGKPVPAEVLKDYPDLVKAIPKAEAVPEAERVIKRIVQPVAKFYRLHDILVAKTGKFTGEIPETITQAQYRAITGKEMISPTILKKVGAETRVRTEYALDELADRFGIDDQELIRRLHQFAKNDAQIREWELLAKEVPPEIKQVSQLLEMIEAAVNEFPIMMSWDTMAVADRVVLAKVAGLEKKIGSKVWTDLSKAEREAIGKAVPKPAPGELETGLQARFAEDGAVVWERFEPGVGKGVIRQLDLEEWGKYRSVMETVETATREEVAEVVKAAKMPRPKLPKQVDEKKFQELKNGILADIRKEAAIHQAKATYYGNQYKAVLRTARSPWKKHALWEHPAFGHRLYDDQIFKAITEAVAAERGLLSVIATVSGTLRTLVAALDLSGAFIQGLPLLGMDFANAARGRATAYWAKAFGLSTAVAFSPKRYAQWIVKEEKAIADFIYYRGQVMGSGGEFYEAMGMMQRQLRVGERRYGTVGAIPAEIFKQTYGRAEAAFGAFGDMARIYLWKSLKPMVKPAELYDLSAMVNKMTGVLDLKGLGLSATTRQLLSSFVFFAPRYSYAGLSLIGEIFRGGIRGKLARESLAGLLVGGQMMYVGTCLAIGQKPRLNPFEAGWLSIQVGKHWVGIGGFQVAAARFLANLVAGKDEKGDFWLLNPKNWISKRESPFLKFMYNRTSIISSAIIAMIDRRTFMGEWMEEPEDYARYLASMVTPISVQDILLEEAEPTLGSIVASILGMRVSPLSPWAHLRNTRDALAPFASDKTAEQLAIMEKRVLTWQDLNVYQKRALREENEELQQLTDEAFASKAKRGSELDRVYQEWQTEGKKIKEFQREGWDTAIAEYNYNMELKRRWQEGETILAEDLAKAKAAGQIFRDKLKEIQLQVSGSRRVLEESERFKEVYLLLDEWKAEDDPAQFVGDIAYEEYVELMFVKEGLTDKFGNYLFDEAEKRENDFEQKWGVYLYDYVKRRLAQSKDEPELLKELRKARELLRPYWEIEETLIASGKYPEDTSQQEEWAIRKLEGQRPEYARLYQQMRELELKDPMRFEKLRGLAEWQTLVKYVNVLKTPTVEAVKDTERLAWRRVHPEGDVYLQMFYDLEPIGER